MTGGSRIGLYIESRDPSFTVIVGRKGRTQIHGSG